MLSFATKKLAIRGGNKVIQQPFKRYNSIGQEEREAAKKVIESGVLSQFIGAWNPDFYGGPKVLEFEEVCKKYFDVKHCVTVNSWTSGLIAAVGALDIEPGDEIITSPWTMAATATAILQWNALPVFADIESETFCLDPTSIEANISPYTKAIIAVDIFGHSANMEAISNIARKYNLKVISDTAQSPSARYHGKFAGTIADIGGYSLNYHKHIHTGEGGILVTNDDKLAERLRLIRNHAEAVVAKKEYSDLNNMLGYNFRLGEIESAMGIEQFKKVDELVRSRQKAAEQLTAGFKGLTGLRLPIVKENCSHVYYVYPMIIDTQTLGISRTTLIDALKAEGIPNISGGYQNLHLLPVYQKKIAYGSAGFPWNNSICKRDINYQKGICPVAEALHENTFMSLAMCSYELNPTEVEWIITAFKKVWENLDDLR